MSNECKIELSIDTRKSLTNLKNEYNTFDKKTSSNINFGKYNFVTRIKPKTHRPKIFIEEQQLEISLPIQIKRYAQEKLSIPEKKEPEHLGENIMNNFIFNSFNDHGKLSNMKTNHKIILPQVFINDRLASNQSYSKIENFRFNYLHRALNIRKLKNTIENFLHYPNKSISDIGELIGRNNNLNIKRPSMDNAKTDSIGFTKNSNFSKNVFKERGEISIQKVNEQIKLLLCRNGKILFQPSLLKNFKKIEDFKLLSRYLFSRKVFNSKQGFFVKAQNVKLNEKIVCPKIAKDLEKSSNKLSPSTQIRYPRTRQILIEKQNSINNPKKDAFKTLSHIIKKREIKHMNLFKEDNAPSINGQNSNKSLNNDIIY